MKPIDQNLLRPNQIEELKRSQEDLQAAIYGQPDKDGHLRGYRSSAPADVRAQLKRVDKMLADQAPEPLTLEEEDKAVKLERELRAEILPGMLSAEEMRKNPATAVDRHMKWEKAKKALIMRWKNLRLQLHAGSGERDVANLEQFRPEHSGHRIMTDAQIPGLHTMSAVAKDNFDTIFPNSPTCDTAEKQVKRRKEMSEEDKQKARKNLALARAKKLVAQADAAKVEAV